jgi:hypothetical protein
MGAFICFPCGTQYTPTAKPPDTGAICDEVRAAELGRHGRR